MRRKNVIGIEKLEVVDDAPKKIDKPNSGMATNEEFLTIF